MSDQPDETKHEEYEEKPEAEKKEKRRDMVTIWAWPKSIVFWPMCLCALIFGFLSLGSRPHIQYQRIEQAVQPYATKAAAQWTEQEKAPAAVKTAFDGVSDAVERLNLRRAKWLGIVFLAIFAFNLIAFSFDIEVRGLAIIILAACVIVFASIVFSANFNILGFLKNFVNNVMPMASAAFYFLIGGLTLAILLVAMISSYLHRVVVTSNQVRVRTGLLEAEKRYSTQRLTYTKQITDLMEHWFLFFGMFSKSCGCGRLIFNHPQLDEPIILDNVIGVEAKSEKLDRLLGVLSVRDND